MINRDKITKLISNFENHLFKKFQGIKLQAIPWVIWNTLSGRCREKRKLRINLNLFYDWSLV